jgi:hypothetical protein
MESSQAAVAALIALLDPNVGAAKAGPFKIDQESWEYDQVPSLVHPFYCDF